MRVTAVCLVLFFAAQVAFAAVDSTLISLAPPSSTVLTGIDVQRAASSSSGTLMLQKTIDDQDLATLLSSIGLDVRRDLRHLLLVELGQEPVSEAQTAVIASGSFDPARLTSAARKRGASVKRYRGLTVVEQRQGTTTSAVAFSRPGVLVTGDLATVQAVLASEAHAGNIDAVLRDEVNQIGPGNDVWFATTLSGSLLAERVADALPSQLRSSGALDRISRCAGGLQFGPSDEVILDLVARSPGDARLLSGVLRVAGTLAHLQLGGTAGLVLAGSVLSSMQVSVEGSTVHAVSTVPDELVERALTSSN